ncbi:MAG: hypothetical protein GY750_08135 [Lentisphaerae bacterium]|nr:hypothetical protein [Lentisphaerota bacterium]MCP4101377.1 hypothetical protein [Lentisphaerota bacterium]
MRVVFIKFFIFVCLFVFFFQLNGYDIEELAVSRYVFTPPAIAENGRSFVYTGVIGNTREIAIFVSHMNNNGTFSKPVPAVTTKMTVVGLNQRFNSFLPFSGQYTPTGFNSPTIQNDIIAFSGTLDNWKQGVFYAIKSSGRWQAYPIAMQGEKIPEKQKLFFKSFNAPYCTINSEVIFLASLENKIDVVYKCRIPHHYNGENITAELQCFSDANLFNFYNISVAQGNFAMRAQTATGKSYIHVFDHAEKKLVIARPEDYTGLPKGNLSVGGPSFFDGKVAYSVSSSDEYGKVSYAIYTNAGNNRFSKPVVTSGKAINSSNSLLLKLLWNPTLFIKDNKAYIVFMGYLTENESTSGIYLAEIENGKVSVKAVAVPGQKLSGNRIISSAEIGAVGIRNGVIPMALKMNDGDSVIAVTKIY